MKTQTLKNLPSFSRIAASFVVLGALGAASPAFASTESKSATQPAPAKKVTRVAASSSKGKLDKALRKRTNLPKSWVWQKDAKSFDSMFRK